jgi:hypothetical protein
VPKDLDKAMAMNPCQQSSPAAPSAVIIPHEEKDESFKVPPFTLKNKYSP